MGLVPVRILFVVSGHHRVTSWQFPNNAYNADTTPRPYDHPTIPCPSDPAESVHRLVFLSDAMDSDAARVMKGPLNAWKHWYPPEFLWSYRFASALIYHYGELEFKDWATLWNQGIQDDFDDRSITASTHPSSSSSAFDHDRAQIMKRPLAEDANDSATKRVRLWRSNVASSLLKEVNYGFIPQDCECFIRR